jgi:hypothetical protein
VIYVTRMRGSRRAGIEGFLQSAAVLDGEDGERIVGRADPPTVLILLIM